MSLRKLCFFTILATIIFLVAVGRLNDRQIRKVDVSKASTPPYGPAFAAERLCYSGRPTNKRDRSRWVEAFRGEGEMLPTTFLPLQSKNAENLAAGKLLVASRNLADPNFTETVVLLVHYDAQGVVGLVLNRRTDVPLSRVLKDLKAAKDLSDPVYLGGPLEPVVFALFQSPTKIEGAEHIFGEVYLITAKTLFEQTIASRPDPGVFRVYLGYAGWTGDQLRKEVELGAWFIFPADSGTVFNADPDSLWSQMIRKTELKMAASEPVDARPASEKGTVSMQEYDLYISPQKPTVGLYVRNGAGLPDLADPMEWVYDGTAAEVELPPDLVQRIETGDMD